MALDTSLYPTVPIASLSDFVDFYPSDEEEM